LISRPIEYRHNRKSENCLLKNDHPVEFQEVWQGMPEILSDIEKLFAQALLYSICNFISPFEANFYQAHTNRIQF